MVDWHFLGTMASYDRMSGWGRGGKEAYDGRYKSYLSCSGLQGRNVCSEHGKQTRVWEPYRAVLVAQQTLHEWAPCR